jgi:CubicO group peptidase (beta-lactamase class C family)
VFDPVAADRILLQGPGQTTPKPWALPIAGYGGSLALAKYGTGGTLPCLGLSTVSLGASGMAADAPSLARWGWGLFSGEIVKADTLAAMIEAIGVDGYGLGIERFTDFPPATVYGHSGSGVGYSALLAVLPERQTVVVVFINEEGADTTAGAWALLAAINR